MKHIAIVPLIGGEVLGAELAHGVPPEYLLSYEAFGDNDKHIVNYYDFQGKDVPYYVLDKGDKPPSTKIDVVSSVCPCAGLSQFSHGYGDHNENNKWLPQTTEYVLSTIKPEVLWGENAPGFAGKIGDTVRTNLYNIGRRYGYSMTVYRTRTLLHGGPQVRERSFYFFWKGDKTPVLEYYNRPYARIEDVLKGVKSNFQHEPINKKIPSKSDPYYRFILEHMYGGIDHKTFSTEKMVALNVRSNDVLSFIENAGITYDEVGTWMQANGYEREVERCKYRKEKLEGGGNIMRRGTMVPLDHIGAFVGHYPLMLTHPIEDRYITYREAMTIMGLPNDFELLNPAKSVNHICQNVPVQTAKDMAWEVDQYLKGNRPTIASTYTYQSNHSQTLQEWARAETTLEEFL